MVAVHTDPAAVGLLENAVANATHLKPMWERIRIKDEGDRVLIGVPVQNKVTQETCDNHARHFYSLLKLLGVPLAATPMAVEMFEVEVADIEPIPFDDPRDRKNKKAS